MSKVIVKRGNDVLYRCGNCREPVVIRTRRHIHIAGSFGLGKSVNDALVARSACPKCATPFEVPNLDTLVKSVEAK